MFNEEITKIGNALGLKGKFLVDFGFEQIMAIIDPPPEMEDGEVMRYVAITPDGKQFDSCEHESPLFSLYGDRVGWSIIPLTGTYRRPKPQPIKRSVKVTFCGNGANGYLSVIDLTGKAGTFTWTE